MFGGAAQQQAPQGRTQQQAPQNPLGDSPWGKILQDMLGGQTGGQAGGPAGTSTGRSAPQQRRAPEPEPQQNPSGRQRNPYDDIFGKMFETGSQQRDDYEKNIGSVFDQFLKGMDRR